MPFSSTMDSAVETARKSMSRGARTGRKTAEQLRVEAARLRAEADRILDEAEQTFRQEMDSALHDAADVGRHVYDGAHRPLQRSANQVQGFVKDRPMTALTAAMALGLVIGFISRR